MSSELKLTEDLIRILGSLDSQTESLSSNLVAKEQKLKYAAETIKKKALELQKRTRNLHKYENVLNRKREQIVDYWKRKELQIKTKARAMKKKIEAGKQELATSMKAESQKLQQFKEKFEDKSDILAKKKHEFERMIRN